MSGWCHAILETYEYFSMYMPIDFSYPPHKADGISIPSSYTAFVAPISSSKLYNEAHASKDEKGPETPYVVMLQAINIMSGDGGGISGKCGAQVQECWEFEHPRRDAVLNSQGKVDHTVIQDTSLTHSLHMHRSAIH